MRPLGLDEYLAIAAVVTGADPAALAALPRLDAAKSAPAAGFGSALRYPELHQQAAVLCSRLIRNHPLPDHNKRVAYLAMVMYIGCNGGRWRPTASAGERAATLRGVAAGALSEDAFALWVARQLA